MSTEILPIPQPDGTIVVKVYVDGKPRTKTLSPGMFVGANQWRETDLAQEPDEVKGIAQIWWTPERVQMYKDAHPWVAPPAKSSEDVRREAFSTDANTTDLINRLRAATPTQIANYVNSNVTDLASAKVLLTKIIMIIGTMV